MPTGKGSRARSAGRRNPQRIFGDIIREMRRGRGLSQRGLAATMDLERSTLAYIEQGKRQPSLGTILELSRALGVLPSEILRELEKRLQVRDHTG